MPIFKRGCVVLLLMSAAACWLPSGPSSSASVSVDGTWVGTTSDSLSVVGNIRATISQSGGSLSGTWVSTNSGNTTGGMLSGSLNGSSVSVTLTPSSATTCPLSVTATVNGNQITGTFAAVSCALTTNGSISLTKQ